jgi:hypothetical protein
VTQQARTGTLVLDSLLDINRVEALEIGGRQEDNIADNCSIAL